MDENPWIPAFAGMTKATLQACERAELEQSGQPAPLPLFTICALARLAARSAGTRSHGNPQNTAGMHGGMRFAFKCSNPSPPGKACAGQQHRRRNGIPGGIKILSIRAIRTRPRAGKA